MLRIVIHRPGGTPRFDPLHKTYENRSVLACNLARLFHESDLLRDAMDSILGLLRDRRLRPLPVTCFRLANVGDAHRALESGLTVGKPALLASAPA